MEKPADNQYPIHDLLRRRWSPLAFDSRPIEQEKLQSVFEAARWSSSAFNEQPWRFIIGIRGENPAAFDAVLQCLESFNQAWAQNAPVLGIAAAKLRFTHNDAENLHAVYDLGQAMANLTVEATNQGLFVHQMAGFDREKATATFHIPDLFVPLSAFAIGYGGDPANLATEKLRDRHNTPTRARKPFAEFVFTGDWEQPDPLTNSSERTAS